MTASSPLAERLPGTAKLLSTGLDRLHPGWQLYVSLRGECVVEVAAGVAIAGEPLTIDHRMPWLSAGKPLTACAILQQVEAGRLTLETPVCEQLPEFAAHGKEGVTLRHLLTHTAGLQPIPTGWPRLDWGPILERILSAKLRHGAVAGECPAYDPQRTWFVLGEWLRRLTGLEFDVALRQAVFDPLGMDRSGFLANRPAELATVPLARLHRCDEGGCQPEPDSQADDACASPGSSFRAPARDLATFYETLLNGGERRDRRILSTALTRKLTTRQRVDQFDLTFQHRVDFGLGVMIDSNHHGRETVPYGFGRHCSPDTFGHGGSECAMAFADPHHQLVVALATTGRPGEALHQGRNREICSAIYVDLGLAGQ